MSCQTDRQQLWKRHMTSSRQAHLNLQHGLTSLYAVQSVYLTIPQATLAYNIGSASQSNYAYVLTVSFDVMLSPPFRYLRPKQSHASQGVLKCAAHSLVC